MPISVLWELALLPILLSGGFMVVHMSLKTHDGISAAVLGGLVCLIFILSEGPPPFFPISSKQKIPYILATIATAAIILRHARPSARAAATAALLLGGFLWLVQRQLSGGAFQTRWILPLLAAVVLTAAVRFQNSNAPSRFAWPVTLLAMMTVTGVIALLGGFIGVGQIMMSISVCFGGVVLLLFLAALRKTGPTLPALPASALWAITTAFGILLILIGTYATNLSTGAYLLVLTMILAPSIERFTTARPLWAHPFIFAAVAALPALPAVFLAVLNF